MPELPDVEVYVEHLAAVTEGTTLERIRLGSPFVLRTVDPPIRAVEGRAVATVRRLGKRVVLGLAGEAYLVIHLMVAGRLRWRRAGHVLPKKHGLAALDFTSGTLLFTEAGSTKRASIHLLHGSDALQRHAPGGIEVLACGAPEFRNTLIRENRTLKRALTDPRLFSGIGNAYSDEILHAARLSPLQLTRHLTDEQVDRLFRATVSTLRRWIDRLRQEAGAQFPEKVTAFRKGMAVHGRYRQPCPICESPVQRIVYAKTEVNYCATCQTAGRLLADRAFSRLLRDDWPRTLEEWEFGNRRILPDARDR